MKFSRCVLLVLLVADSLSAQETFALRERYTVGSSYQVRTRVQISGKLTPPAESGQPAAKPLSLTGESAIDYCERVLTLDASNTVSKTIRQFQRVDFDRQVGDTPQQATLRAAVRRVVLLRHNSKEVAFSPDGPLTWGELDLLRTDVFTPGLQGLFPTDGVRVGDRWKASVSAVQELTDLDSIDQGEIVCRLERIVTVDKRRQARISLSGTLTGTNEDGPTQQDLDGYILFDLESNHLSVLSIQGKHLLLDAGRKEMGRVEGRFVLTRQLVDSCKELTEEALKGMALEPNASNTGLLYDNPDLGLEFLHPRRWRVSGVQGQQVTLDSADGSGLLLTVDPPERVPTGAQFLKETRDWLEKQKARVVQVDAPQTVKGAVDSLEHFALRVEMSGAPFVMDYYVVKQAGGGATLAARLLPGNANELQKEIETIARSVRVLRATK